MYQSYNISLKTFLCLQSCSVVNEMHWHVFLNLFNTLPEDVPIKQRMFYRSVNLSSIKDKNERKRIRKIIGCAEIC
ncbi:MAG: bacteriophage Gp15 family protein [Oscillospiraceae bacterium]|nr:bacteriophage Gp15 family protein [Oscillospiraceae bacterium]